VRRASVLEQKKDGFGLGLLKILKSLGFYWLALHFTKTYVRD
jgi:hypothetical protein